MTSEYIEELESAIIDLLDSTDVVDIEEFTQCSPERCIELKDLYFKVIQNYHKRHNI